MPYATSAQLIAEFGATEINRLADKNNNGNPDEIAAVLQSAQDFSTSRINAIVGDRIQPILANPDLVVGLTWAALDIMRWRLYGTRVTDEVRERYEDALKSLKSIREGVEGLGNFVGAQSVAATESTIQIDSLNHRWGGGSY